MKKHKKRLKVGDHIEMLFNGSWNRGKVIKGYRYDDGIVTMQTDTGKIIWCGEDRKDLYHKMK